MQPTPQVLQAIETAIQIEKEGQAFYKAAARQTQDPRSKRMFQSLAKEEEAHLKLFQDSREALLERGQWLSPPEVAAISPSLIDRPAIFPPQEEIEGIETSAQMLSVLRRGIQAEEASIKFYAEQMEAVEDPHARAMYAYLIEQETVHQAILQAQYGYVDKTTF